MLALICAAPRKIHVASVGPTSTIPRDSFKTWSLFLICNPDWVTPEKSEDLAHLYRRFNAFGDAIGDDNLAVWFWKRSMREDDSRLAKNVDIARSARYCRELKLRPTAGPFLVVTSDYPKVEAFPLERAVFEMGGLPPADVAKLLNTLTDQLLLQGNVDVAEGAAAPASPSPPSTRAASNSATASVWIRLLEGARRSMIGFGCKLNFRINTGVISAEVRECAGT